MSDNQPVKVGGVSLCGYLGLIFITLKLCGIITWSWWWVTAPFWGGLAIALSLGALVAIGFLLVCVAVGAIALGKGLLGRKETRRP